MLLAMTGITSGVGRRLAEIAIEQGHVVRGLVRDPNRADAQALQALGVTLVAGDLLDTASLTELCQGSEGVMHFPAHVGDWGPREQFEQINVQGTKNVVEAAAKGGAKRFVHMSSVAVYGRPDTGRVTEETSRVKTGVAYDDSKADAEEMAFERGGSLGLGVTAIRPPVIYGPYDRNFIPRSLRLLRNGRFRLVGGGHNPLNLVWVDHVCDLSLLALHNDKAIGEAFNVMDTVSETPPSVREVAAAIAEAVGLPPPTGEVPYAAAMVLATIMSGLYKLVRSKTPPPVTPFVVRLTKLHVIYDASKATRLLGWKPRMDPLKGVAQFARLLDNPT